jgi:hypothetical protein
MLEEQRSQFRTEIVQLLVQGATSCGSDGGSCSCAWSSRHSLAYIELLETKQLQPRYLNGMPLTQIMDTVDRMSDPTLPHNTQPCRYRWHTQPRYREFRIHAIDLLKARDGLCIDCGRICCGTLG